MFERLRLQKFVVRISKPGRPSRASGFTILELMIVIAIILILIGVAAGRYDRSVKIARESRLKNDLQVLRVAIDNYTLDKQSAPNSLQDLVDAHYLRTVPNDPITNQQDWVLHTGETVLSPDQVGTGVDDVHSASDQISLEGTPYNTW
jgi:general secretion pathway protein G